MAQETEKQTELNSLNFQSDECLGDNRFIYLSEISYDHTR